MRVFYDPGWFPLWLSLRLGRAVCGHERLLMAVFAQLTYGVHGLPTFPLWRKWP